MRVARIGHRLLLTVGLVAGTGLAAVMLLYGQRQEQSILRQNEAAMMKVTDSTVQGLQAIMARGYAEIAHGFIARLKKVDRVIDYRVLRMDGREAFLDNETIDAVNARLPQPRFDRRGDPLTAPQVLAADDPNVALMRARGDHVFAYETRADGSRVVMLIEPIHSSRACEKCHDRQQPMRGFVLLKTSLAAVDADIARTWASSVILIGFGMLLIFATVWWVAQRSIVRPIGELTAALLAAGRGDLGITVAADSDDEIAVMARSFNEMSTQLRHGYAALADRRDKLTTIIRSSHDGIVLADALGRVVLVNPAAQLLLGKSEGDIVRDGFLALVDDVDWMEWRLAGQGDEAGDGVREHRGRMLAIEAWTLRSEAGEITGSAAMLRDVTEERQLDAQLQSRAITDALTGLFNRRHCDSRLADEYARWRRYQVAFSILLLDVDHFKRFNDTHGHECGDQVLRAIGDVLRQIDDAAAVACRYGGEELLVILPDCGQNAGVAAAEALRAAVAALQVNGLHVTVSIGVAGCPPQQPADAAALVKLADAALYRAKAEGRNRVVAAP